MNYYAATVLHPAIRWDFLHRAYRERPGWIGKAQQLIDGLWQEYKQLPVQFERGNYDQLRPIKRAKEVEDSFSSYLDSFKSTTTARLEGNEGDELDRHPLCASNGGGVREGILFLWEHGVGQTLPAAGGNSCRNANREVLVKGGFAGRL
ncbi:uncharacterized protein FPOAC1_013396 [Fusarium poae]|uniref:uncharacterized protein n=1 Tax=Fusarium poae TaxID=36050 RepID=UPI001D048C08|nr:uncharacterized protein FPOAC1_013396 [Fusarium poae]KAG8664616.1 hypothetical protein FPOAC1_013396 [Fusarium poae]